MVDKIPLYLLFKLIKMQTDLVPGLGEGSSEPSGDVMLVSNAFADIEKDSRAHRAIACVLKDVGSIDAAENELKKSIEIAATDLDRFYALVALAQVYEKLSEDDVSKTEEAYRTIDQALAIRPQRKDGDDSNDVASQIRTALLIRANFEYRRGDVDEAMKLYDEAREARPEYPLDGNVYDTITIALETREQYTELIAKVESWTEIERLLWLEFHEEADEANIRFRKAVQISGKEEGFLVKCYQDIIKLSDSISMRYQLAIAYRTVLKDNHRAKSVLHEILDKGIYGALSDLTDIILEEFRSTSDSAKKAASLQEMKNLLSQPLLTAYRDTSPKDSQSAVALAIMMKKVGPASEFAALMREIFDTCVKGLSDRVGWNDGLSFRLLAKCLACIPGLEREAQIAISCQFSIVDPTLFPSVEEEDDKVKQDENRENSKKAENDKTDQDIKENLENNNRENEKDETGNNSPCGSAEDLSPSEWCSCDGCGETFSSWAVPIYYCILCFDCDLCEDCYQKRKTFDRGEGESVTYCGRNHRHIRGPIHGWKGVKDGVITIGDQKVKFSDWLIDLKDKRWKEAWETFWTEDPVRDIL